MDFTKLKFQLTKWGLIFSGCLNLILIAVLVFLIFAYIPKTKKENENSNNSSSSSTSSTSSASSSSTSSVSTSTSTAERTSVKITFTNGRSITFKTSKATEQNKSFFNMQIKEVNENVTPDTLYDTYPNDWDNYRFFVTPKNVYYELEPGGYSVMKLITQNDLDNILKGKINKTADFEEQTTCSTSRTTVGGTNFTALKCDNVIKYSGLDEFTPSGSNTACLYSFSSEEYFYYGTESAPVGSDTDSCAALAYYNVTSVEVKD